MTVEDSLVRPHRVLIQQVLVLGVILRETWQKAQMRYSVGREISLMGGMECEGGCCRWGCGSCRCADGVEVRLEEGRCVCVWE